MISWTLEEKKNYRPLVYRNTVESMQTICSVRSHHLTSVQPVPSCLQLRWLGHSSATGVCFATAQGMELLKIPFEDPDNMERAGRILQLNVLNVALNVVEDLQALWKGTDNNTKSANPSPPPYLPPATLIEWSYGVVCGLWFVVVVFDVQMRVWPNW